MVNEWQVLEFGTLLEGGTRNGIYKPKQFHGGGAKMVNMGELFAYPRLRSVKMRRVQLTDDELSKSSLQAGDLLFARRSLVAEGAGKCSIVCEVNEPTTFESSIIRARPNSAIADSLFLYYFFSSSLGKYSLGTILRQMAVSGITGTDLVRLQIPVPPLTEQRAIAHILGTFDDKIELNRRMNETLEALARVIFKAWFVDFDPVRAKMEGRQPAGMDAETAALFPAEFEDSVLGQIPRGWKVATLAEHLSADKGLSYKGEGLSKDRHDMPMHNLNSVLEGGGYKYAGIKYYMGEYKERHVLKPGDIIVTNTEQGFDYLLIGYPAIVPKHFGEMGIFSHHIFRVRPLPKSSLKTHFIYHLLMSPLVRDQITGCTNGTTVNMLSADGLRIPSFVLPPGRLIELYESFATPIFAKMEQIHEESINLAALRDTLLPKLLNGEVRVMAT
jgi:type I restriction enzyme, S subunit